MNILILNWRDPKNPKSGGAEKLNMHILRPFLDRGDQVTWYAMTVDKLPKKEHFNGITIVRFGNAFTHLLLWSFFYWSGKFGKIDFIIDSIHGTGYLSPLIAPKAKKKILICEVAQNIWDEMYPFPINKIGKAWENIMFWFYRSDKFWTISNSTKNDLIHRGISSKSITVLPMGFDGVRLKIKLKKYQDPTALFVGRLAEMKGIKDVIKAISEVNKNALKKWRLNIIGRGDPQFEKELRDMVYDLGIGEYVSFLGYVDEKMKFEEMAKAWVLLAPSSREGWGMIVPEANSVGTPAIGYNVPGLRDALAYYAQENISINPSPSALVREITKIKKMIIIKKKIQPGWQEMYAFIKNQI